MSASRSPTAWPALASATARLAATVLLPTPPLPLATASSFLMPGTVVATGRASAGTLLRSAVRMIRAIFGPATRLTATSTSA